MPGTYISPAETGFYYLNSRYYDPETGRFLNADNAVSGTGDSVQGYNLFAYCFNNPINMNDPDGNWPKWLEKTVKVASVAIAVAAVVTTVVAVSAFTAGTGSAAAVWGGASVFLGAALSGINGGIANEKQGNSYTNGYVGGATGGTIQGLSSKHPLGTALGGSAGVAVGTVVTGAMNNWDPDSANLSTQDILKNATTSGAKGLLTSSMTAYVGYSADIARIDGCAGLMPSFSYGFAEGMKAFFGWADDALVYIWE